jgi:hypothetical protein
MISKHSAQRILDIARTISETGNGDLDWYESYAAGHESEFGIMIADWNGPGQYELDQLQRAEERYQETLFDPLGAFTDQSGRYYDTANFRRDSVDRCKKDIATKTAIARIGELAEKAGIDTEWSDTHTGCYDCNRLIQTEPDCYSWTPQFKVGDGWILCKDCLLEDPEQYLTDCLLNNSDNADTFDVDLSAIGFVELSDGESGFHPGQTDNPRTMVESVPKGFDYVFQIDNTGQFDTRFSLWIRPDSAETYAIRSDEASATVIIWMDKDDAPVESRYEKGEKDGIRRQIAELREDGYSRLGSITTEPESSWGSVFTTRLPY